MEDLEEKVNKQSQQIDQCIIHFKAALMTFKVNRYQYDSKEYSQKTSLLEGFIEILQDLKIK